MLKVGVIGFGGGSALIPVIEREVVGRPGGVDEPTFTQDTVIANITPGALPTKLAALTGIQVGGPLTAVLAAILVSLPGAALTVALLAFFAALGPGGIRVLEFASIGISGFILYLLYRYVAKVLRGRNLAYALIALAAFVLTGSERVLVLVTDVTGARLPELPELSALQLVVLAIVVIAVVSAVQRRRRGREAPEGGAPADPRPVLVAAALAMALVAVAVVTAVVLGPDPGALLGLVTFSTLSSFGGGEAYTGVADGFFVSSGLVEETVFYGQIVPVSNALPGPTLIKLASGISYAVGVGLGGTALGVVLAVAAFLASTGVCTAIALGLLAGYGRARHSLFVRNLGDFILPVICGLLASTAVSIVHSALRIAGGAGVPGALGIVGVLALAVVAALVHRTGRVPDIGIILAGGALSLALLLAVQG